MTRSDAFAQLADPDTFDPTEELSRRDMALLLDRALGYLPPESRAAVEQHYLAEIPQRELAARMGLSLSAMEARLHRARGQMLRTFSQELRDEALALGLAILPADAVGWRKTQITCYLCGRVRMEGMFEPMAGGRINMRLRCPACQTEEINTLGLVELEHARSFSASHKEDDSPDRASHPGCAAIWQHSRAVLGMPAAHHIADCAWRRSPSRIWRADPASIELWLHTFGRLCPIALWSASRGPRFHLRHQRYHCPA